MLQRIDDLHIDQLKTLISPAQVHNTYPIIERDAQFIAASRQEVTQIIQGHDDRLLVIVGPCSIHDPVSAMAFGQQLKQAIAHYSEQLCLVMRVYFEKPRTTIGWKGLINDPHLDSSFDINEGLQIARRLLVDLTQEGIPTATEFLDTITPQYMSDLVSWGAIGARTTESQIHRELASGLSMPIGFKNGTDGNIQIAMDAIQAASNPHHFLGVTKNGLAAIVSTHGNTACHLILRGSSSGPNYDEVSVNDTIAQLQTKQQQTGLMIDCSHGNSRKDHRKQSEVAASVAQQVANGNAQITGVMLESHLVEGKQALKNKADLTYGQSITDACLSWQQTEPVLAQLAQAVMQRRRQQ
jgi:3-deoxy-7-phosphoheptulonate synthase